jgi:hypothetical protein
MMRFRMLMLPLLASIAGCDGENTSSNVTSPGSEETAKTKTLETGAKLLQDKTPIRSLNSYMDGFHFYNGNRQAQMEAHHYCGHLNEEVIQCVIFDGNDERAKLMGVEYIISPALFEKLPTAEKHLWHSHVHEVRSGQLIAPGIPEVAEHELMEKIAGTYGKTWHTWHTDQEHDLPLGTPMLMMGFTQDGQVNQQMVTERDKRFDVSSADNRRKRSDIDYPAIDTDADAWAKGVVLQLEATRKVSEQSASMP